MVANAHVWLFPSISYWIIGVPMFVGFVLAVWSFFSAARLPDRSWQQAGISKVVWLVSLVVSIVLIWPLAAVLGYIYVLTVRPRLKLI